MDSKKKLVIDRIRKCVCLLESHFGELKQVRIKEDLIGGLIRIILSQSTSDVNSDRAYQELRNQFPTNDLLDQGSKKEIMATIRSAGLYRQKSQRIKDILDWIKVDFGKLNIDEICNWSNEEVINKFTSQKGIGVKTVAVLLVFYCNKDIFPVDTHVHRISKRLQFVHQNASAEKTFFILDPLIPTGKSYSFHVNLLKLGRQICHSRKPKCEFCPLNKLCPFYKNIG